MRIEIDLKVIKENNISINQYLLLYFLFHKDFENLKMLDYLDALVARNALIKTQFILSDENTKIAETIIAKDKVGKLLGLKSDKINFWAFYNEYPVRVGSRVLRSSGTESELFKKHREKYLKKVKTQKQHQEAVEAIKAYVAKKKRENNLQYLEQMDRVLNNSLWEVWTTFVEENKNQEDSLSWNTETI